ncbi:alkaline shock response membrane anchor protein AmaP, partial [Streptomyces mirabilis]
MTPRTVLNRSLLALAGLVLLGGGLLVLFAGLDVYRRHDLVPPVGWPLTTPHDVLLGSADRARWSGQGWWWWPAVIAALTLVALLALWWLLAQLHRRHPGALPVGGTPPQEGVELRDHALSDAIA